MTALLEFINKKGNEMSYSPSQMYPGAVSVDSDYIDGKFKDCSDPEIYDGTPLDVKLFNQNLALQDAIMTAAQLDYNNQADTPESSQLFKALELSRSADNRFKEGQNFNIKGDGSLPNSFPRIVSVGTEISKGRFVTGSSLINMKYEDGLFSASSGQYYIEVLGDFSDDFYGIKLEDDSISQTGVTLSVVGVYTRVTVDMGVAPTHKFAGLSEKRGVWPDVSNDESSPTFNDVTAENANVEELTTDKLIAFDEVNFNQNWGDYSAVRYSNQVYANNTGRPIQVSIWAKDSGADAFLYVGDINDNLIVVGAAFESGTSGGNACIIVPNGKSYKVTGNFTGWAELR